MRVTTRASDQRHLVLDYVSEVNKELTARPSTQGKDSRQMWRTPLGERVLRGAEWNLFREGLLFLGDFVEDSSHDPDICFTGVGVFDRLEPAQKLIE